jgi:type II secretory pathway component PulF
MPEYAYIARSLDGKTTRGSISAESRHDAISELRQKSLYPLTIKDAKARSAAWADLLPQRRISPDVLSTHLNQLADLLQNGVSILEALDILAKESTHPRLASVLSEVKNLVAEGVSFEDALARYPQQIPDICVSIVRAGAEGGFLEDALRRVSEYLERQAELRGKITSAMAYPAFLVVAGIVVTVFLMLFIVPRFQTLFDRLLESGAGLPLITQILLSIRLVLLHQGWLILLGLAAAIIALQKVADTVWGRAMVDRWILKMPLFGDIVRQSSVSRFCRILGTLLSNGVPLLRSLEISSKSIGNSLLERAVVEASRNVSAGETLSKPLSESKLIPATTMAMIRIAEESNSLDRVLLQIADANDKKIQRRLDMMVRMIEPMMLLLIAGAVLFILLGLLLPVYDMSNSIG